jgi:hypothetical protein
MPVGSSLRVRAVRLAQGLRGRSGRARVALAVACASVAAVALAACPRRSDDHVPMIDVRPGAAARAMLLRSRSAAGRPNAKPARVHAMVPGEELGGSNALGRPGDLVLENDEVVFVIDQLGSSTGFAESGGNIVDAADARERRDALGQLFTFFGTFPRQAIYTSLESGEDRDGTAWVLAKGHDLEAATLKVATRYALRPGDRALLLETTLSTDADGAVELEGLGDAVQWGATEKFAPGMASGFRGPSRSAFVGGVGRFVSYALAATDGDIEALSGGSWTDTFQARRVRVARGKPATYARVFVVGQRGDSSSAMSELALAAGARVGTLSLSFVGADGARVKVEPWTRVSLARRGEQSPVLTVATTRELDALEAALPPGEFDIVKVEGAGRSLEGARVPLRITPDSRTESFVTVSDVGQLALSCEEVTGGTKREAPCKATVEPLEGAPAPRFGPPFLAQASENTVWIRRGAALVPLAPGKYRVTFSRGLEYALDAHDVVVPRGGQVAAHGGLHRVVDTRGYVAADLHQHTMLGADAPVAIPDRILSNVAEGVEVAVASEHNYVADLRGAVRALGLEPFLVSIPGNEVTTDASPKAFGHLNAFPLEPNAARPRGGAVEVRGRRAGDVIDELRRGGEPIVIQVNHPRSGATGYFDLLGFDPSTGLGNAAYDPRFDALEVWNGRNVEARTRVLDDFFALLRTGHPVTPTANTDTHGVVGEEPGFPRTYVRLDDDETLTPWTTERTKAFVRSLREGRDVVLTNGPFLRVTMNGAPIGGTIALAGARATGPNRPAAAKGAARMVDVAIHVECAPWVDVTRVRVVRASDPNAFVERPIKLVSARAVRGGGAAPTAPAKRVADATIRLAVDADDALVVMALGEKPLRPVLAGDDADILPFAMTGAVWVDADGDGAALGR